MKGYVMGTRTSYVVEIKTTMSMCARFPRSHTFSPIKHSMKGEVDQLA